MLHGGDIYTRKIKYDFSVNTNPNPCPGEIMEAISGSLKYIGNYPDPLQRRVRHELSLLEGIKEEYIICGNGASDLLMAGVQAIKPRVAYLICPCFYGYRHALNSCQDIVVKEYYLREEENFILGNSLLDKVHDDIVSDFHNSDKKSPGILFLTNPNNPSGKNISPEVIENLLDTCSRCNISVILDECFLRMSDKGVSFKKKVLSYNNLYVVDAFTKLFSVPGIRAGYMISNKDNIENIKRYLHEWNLSIPGEAALVAGAKLLRKSDFCEKTRSIIREERKYLYEELRNIYLINSLSEKTELRDIESKTESKALSKTESKTESKHAFTLMDSDTSFILFKANESGLKLFDKLLEEGILIRSCKGFSGLNQDWYRIAVKSHEENKILISHLKRMFENV
ncbi:MAG: aminotransferase class I/II-fold pyridoxal phosphate-dependent enzyme [Eubacterium sp.]|nr:aminotransferase class I/II-fold pyridoxal phosphate-dependent enzyme [Eubacterium sp.]